jgi:drug/metabolite transporter (DMT)-like permease
MAMLAFLLAAFLLALPFRYAGNGEIFSGILTLFAFIGLILILPGMALGALLGARTYRVERRQGTRAGVGIGAAAGLTSYLIFFTLFANMPLLVVPLIASASLLLYALFATGRNLEYRRRVVLLAAGIAVLSGAGALLLSFDLLGLLGALFSVVAAAAGGCVGGAGYARAGGDEMIPPGSTIRRREPRRKPR